MPELFFGNGKFDLLPDLISRYGKRALIITGGISFEKSGRLDELKKNAEQKGLELFIYRVMSEPAPAVIDEAVVIYRRYNLDCVVSIGGGSSLDSGKAVACMLKEEGSISEYLEGIGSKKPTGRKLPFIAVPTTAGTGSEATKNAVITERGVSGFKKSLRHDLFVPDIALIDPGLASGLPSATTAYCALDALSQLIEAYISDNSNLFTDSLAERAICCALDSIMPLCHDGRDEIIFRSNMAYAAYISGIVLANAGLGLCHGIAGPMGGYYDIPHGIACANIIVPSLKFSLRKFSDDVNSFGVYIKKLSKVGNYISGQTGKSDLYYAEFLNSSLGQWVEKLGIPRLSSFMIDYEGAEKIARSSESKNSPVKAGFDDFKAIISERI